MINYYKTKGVFVLELSNEITLTTLADIRSRIDSLNLQQYPKVVVDLSKVSFFDSSGMGYLVILIKNVKLAQGKIALAAPKPMVKKLLTAIKVDRFVNIYDTVEDAIMFLTSDNGEQPPQL
jgi:anti-sigma B factor antagonist